MNKKRTPNQIKPFLAIAHYSLRAMLRNRATVFFGFAFPLIFILGFGLINDQGISLTLGMPKEDQKGPVYDTLSEIEAVKIDTASEASLEEKLLRGRLSGILTYDDTKDTFQLATSKANPEEEGAATSLVNGVVDKLNLKLANVKEPSIKLVATEVSGNTFKFIDFFLPGMIGFALLTTSITSTSFGLIFLKKTLVLKRIFAHPPRD